MLVHENYSGILYDVNERENFSKGIAKYIRQ